MRCSYCGSKLHTEKNCPNTWSGQGNRNAMRCSYCGARDHTIAACPKTWGGSAARAWDEGSVEDEFIRD